MAKRKPQTMHYSGVDGLYDEKRHIAYLDAALADRDPKRFLRALRVIIATKGWTTIAKRTEVSSDRLRAVLSKHGRLELKTTLKVLRAVGLRLYSESILTGKLHR